MSTPSHAGMQRNHGNRRGRAAAAPASGQALPREEQIRVAAYAFYVQRGCVDDHEMDDWLKAEAQVDAAMAGPDAATH